MYLVTYKRESGFTLTEILTTIVVICLLASLSYPLLAASKRRAKAAVCVSNLHQCTTSLIMYSDVYGGIADAPLYAQAVNELKHMPTCDPSDTIRTGCDGGFSKPMVGSYGYVRGLADLGDQTKWSNWVETHDQLYILASTYYGDQTTHPFSGDDLDPCLGDRTCTMPTTLIRSRDDTSVRVQKLPSVVRSGGGEYSRPFTWDNVFETK